MTTILPQHNGGIQGELKVCAQVAMGNLYCLAWVFTSTKTSYLVQGRVSLLGPAFHKKSKSALLCLLSLFQPELRAMIAQWKQQL